MTFLNDVNGRLIGTITDIDSSGTKKIINDKNGRQVGSYDESSNTTFDKNGRSVGTGNQLTMLLRR